MQAPCAPHLLKLVTPATVPAKCVEAGLAGACSLLSSCPCLLEINAAFAAVISVGVLVLDAQLLVGGIVCEHTICHGERLQLRRGVRCIRGKGPGNFGTSAPFQGCWAVGAMPWQTEKQALLVEVVAVFADRIQEGGTARRASGCCGGHHF